jgi:formylglycine-generating enzyme required for sulfatase activity
VTDYWWGPAIDASLANYGKRMPSVGRPGIGLPPPSVEPVAGTMGVSSFKPNAWGLYNVHGNAWEWVRDCWNNDYMGAPEDGSAWTQGQCGTRVLRGGAFIHDENVLRVSYRTRRNAASRGNLIGFRVARSL